MFSFEFSKGDRDDRSQEGPLQTFEVGVLQLIDAYHNQLDRAEDDHEEMTMSL